MSLMLTTKRGTSKKLIEKINFNWAGDTYKEYQATNTATIILQKRNRTVVTSARGTSMKYLENTSIPEQSKTRSVYIATNRGTKRRLIKIN